MKKELYYQFHLFVCIISMVYSFESWSYTQTHKHEVLNAELSNEIQSIIQNTQTQLLQSRTENKFWNYPLYLGSMYTSQYILLRHWLGVSFISGKSKITDLPKSRLNEDYFKSYLLKTQRTDGSWPIIQDFNTHGGDLNATILHYAALKILGVEPNKEVLTKAKFFILKNGGIAKASLFTKIVLSLFGNYSWDDIPSIPYIVFDEDFFLNYKNFGQWIAPHLFPISYLKKIEAKKQLGPNFNLTELWVNPPKEIEENNIINYYSSSNQPRHTDRELLLKILGSQKHQGSFGGYTTATLFSIATFIHYQEFNHDLDNEINLAIFRGLEFIESLYFNSGESSYLGVTCDGRYWDTALVGQSVLESGASPQELLSTSNYLFNIQDLPSGGFGFGLDFEDSMDTDDTAEILLYLKKMGIKNKQTDSALFWLLRMQNDDGGWGAFDRNNNGNFILEIATQDFLDSADMFDESSADVTGHILEALAAYGYNIQNSPAVKRAVDYLIESQDKNLNAWLGRWGSNYIYGTSASLIGLLRTGVAPQSEFIQRSVHWLMQCQNKTDGGFGESFESYMYPNMACKGVSTPSQTAWALMALIEAGQGKSKAAESAAIFLLQSYKNNGNKWIDKHTFVGTGHPKIVPMHYPSYAWAFSIMALSRYLKQNNIPMSDVMFN
jgi:squalene-hopene/tetraprenyl-beta-curcumene cyclase